MRKNGGDSEKKNEEKDKTKAICKNICLRVVLFIWIHYLFALRINNAMICISLFSLVHPFSVCVAVAYVKIQKDTNQYSTLQYVIFVIYMNSFFFYFRFENIAVYFVFCAIDFEWHFSYSNGTWFFTLHSSHYMYCVSLLFSIQYLYTIRSYISGIVWRSYVKSRNRQQQQQNSSKIEYTSINRNIFDSQ